MKSRALIVGGIVLVLALGASRWAGVRDDGDPVWVRPDPVPDAETSGAGLAQPDVEARAESTAIDSTEIVQRLNSAAAVPAHRAVDAPTTDERDITADNIDHLVQANLDHALLQGDAHSAYFVTRARLTCDRFASTPEELQRHVRRIEMRVEAARSGGRGIVSSPDYDRPWSLTEDMDENRAHVERWYDACRRLREIFTPDLRRQLELQALDGDAMARYLYATWPVDMRDDGDAFDRQFRWEDRAREFSLANLYEGEVAGLLAFGHSYMTGLFTARNSDLAVAFGIAALHCGFEIISVRSFLANHVERLTGSDDPADTQRLQLILAESDQLGRFCSP